jgi:hypothetical protein
MELIIAFIALVVIGYFWYYNRNNIKFDEPVAPTASIDAAEKNIKETTQPVVAKVEVTPTPVAEPTPAVKETPWIEKTPAPIAKKPARAQNVKATTAPKKRKPAGK